MEVKTFKEWLKQQNKPRVDAIFKVLRDTGEPVFEGMSYRGQTMANNEVLFEVLMHQNMSDAEFIYDLSDEERAEYQDFKDEVHDEFVKLCDRLFDWFPDRTPKPTPMAGEPGQSANDAPDNARSSEHLPGRNCVCKKSVEECALCGQRGRDKFKGVEALCNCLAREVARRSGEASARSQAKTV